MVVNAVLIIPSLPLLLAIGPAQITVPAEFRAKIETKKLILENKHLFAKTGTALG